MDQPTPLDLALERYARSAFKGITTIADRTALLKSGMFRKEAPRA